VEEKNSDLVGGVGHQVAMGGDDCKSKVKASPGPASASIIWRFRRKSAVELLGRAAKRRPGGLTKLVKKKDL
jgi:hypothetical protein